MDSDLAQFLAEKFRNDLSESVKSLSSSDHMLLKLKDMGDNLNQIISRNPTSPKLIQFLHQLNDFLSQWLIHREQKTAFKNIFSSDAAHATDRHGLKSLDSSYRYLLESTEKSQPHLNFDLDRFTFYESSPSHHIEAFTEHKGKIVDYLLSASSNDDQRFKAVGIYGMGGSGKTALVKQVLKDPKVSRKFEDNIIWACLSHLTSSDEVDIRIVKYMLNYLNYDLDDLTDKQAENNDCLMNQLKHQLDWLGNYVIVLDDLWHCNEWIADFYSKVAKDNTTAAGGGVIIVTSRKKEVVQGLVSGKKKKVDNKGPIMIHVDPWDYMNNNNGNFLKDIVFRNEILVKDDDMEEMDDDMEEMVRLCHGLALPAKELPQLKHKRENNADQQHGEASEVRDNGHRLVSRLRRKIERWF